MNLEGITLYALTKMLQREIIGSQIYRIVMPSSRSLLLGLRRSKDTVQLLIDANGSAPAAWLTDQAPDNPAEPPAFCMLLRKHLEEGRITDVTQLGLDRVLDLEISLLGRNSQILTKHLLLELTGKNANIIFTVDGEIKDCLKHISPSVNSHRAVQPGAAYLPPPPQDGLDVLHTAAGAIVSAVPDEVVDNLPRALIKVTTGIGMVTANQLLARANIPLEATYLTPADRTRLANALSELQQEVLAGRIFTSMISRQNRCLTILPYQPAWTPPDTTFRLFTDLNRALNEAARLEPIVLPEREVLQKTVKNELSRLDRKIKALEKDLSQAEQADKARVAADSLMASLYQIAKGATQCTIPNLYDGTPLHVSLSPVLTPAENAQRYYKKYNKLKRAQEAVAEQLQETKDLRDYLDTVGESLVFATSRRETAEIKDELEKAGVLKAAKKKNIPQAKSEPLKIRYSEDTTIYVGKNNRQNDWLTFKIGSGSDLWFHVQKIAGSHVLLKTSRKEPEPEAIAAAVQLAAYFSKGRTGSNVPVDCVPRRQVKKPAGAKPGFVIFTGQTTYYTTPSEETVRRLLERGK
ncbi:MAG: Rqc2-like protein RqcH [Succiniclasticum sp.]|jgi:predicted ribosome quality control (RQC) complex YloA/Tae2 family protein